MRIKLFTVMCGFLAKAFLAYKIEKSINGKIHKNKHFSSKKTAISPTSD